MVVFEGFYLRSTDVDRGRSRSSEVDRGRDSVRAIPRRPEACKSSESHQHAGLFMHYLVVWIGGPSSGKNGISGPRKGQISKISSRNEWFLKYRPNV